MVGTQQDGKNKSSKEDHGMGSDRKEKQRTSKTRWRDEEINDLRRVTVKNWTHIVRDRKSWCELAKKNKTYKGL